MDRELSPEYREKTEPKNKKPKTKRVMPMPMPIIIPLRWYLYREKTGH